MKHHKIIFLDVDGVLNTCSFGSFIKPHLIVNLHKVLSETKAEIVMSSAWRLNGVLWKENFLREVERSIVGIRQEFREKIYSTLSKSIVGSTEDIIGETREYEVMKFVEAYEIEKFIAIDDLAEHFPSKPDWLILTNEKHGLNVRSTGLAISKLMEM